MTVGDWLGQRAPIAPPRLALRIDEVLGASRDAPRAEAPERCVDAATELLGELLARRSAGRESALDLLAVDGLVTYAFEAAADDPDRLVERAGAAMDRLSRAVA